MNKLRSLALLAITLSPAAVFAADPPPPTPVENAMAITDTATSAFEAITILVVAMVSFYIIVRIVKGIRR